MASTLADGELIESSSGPAYRIVETLPQDHVHGLHPLSHLLRFSTDFANQIDPEAFKEGVPWERLVFLDTETTGLAGGAGTIAFLVGIGSFQGDQFVIQQYFLRDPGEEAAMLTVLREILTSAGAFVTYNGRAFDLPLLEMRYMLSLRARLELIAQPHLDLLFFARRLWRRVLPDCRLNTVESNMLGVERSELDVPGEWIPGMYLDYLRSGDASEMNRVIYHNAVDILSLVGLTAQIFERFESDDHRTLLGAEALAVARWHYEAGRERTAEQVYQAALNEDNPVEVRLEAIRQLSVRFKRQDRRDELVSWWELWHELAPDDITPCIELAMYYEWHAKDYQLASTWAQAALVCLSHQPEGWKQKRDWKAVEHRLKRLASKIEKSPPQA
jgi:uncharacterized protein YprB with RNaseH-like and TPR domain